MQRIFSLMILAGATGCVADHGDESFVISGNLSPMIDGTTHAFLFTPSLMGPFLSETDVDFSDRNTFVQGVIVGSQFESRIVAPEGKESLRTIFVQGANIQLDVGQITFDTNNVLTTMTPPQTTVQFQLPFATAVTPNRGLAAGVYSVVPPDVFETLVAAVVPELKNPNTSAHVQITTTTIAFGEYYGNQIDATPFIYPVFIDHPAPCGDGVCDPVGPFPSPSGAVFEDITSCPADCICGNGICDTTRGETNTTCPMDCP